MKRFKTWHHPNPHTMLCSGNELRFECFDNKFFRLMKRNRIDRMELDPTGFVKNNYGFDSLTKEEHK